MQGPPSRLDGCSGVHRLARSGSMESVPVTPEQGHHGRRFRVGRHAAAHSSPLPAWMSAIVIDRCHADGHVGAAAPSAWPRSKQEQTAPAVMRLLLLCGARVDGDERAPSARQVAARTRARTSAE
jgi:hypothetical protein